MAYRTARALKPLATYGVAGEFLSAYKKTMDETFLVERADPRRVLSLRPSQLPFCSSSFFVKYATQGMLRTMDMSMAFYVNVGSTVHEVLQRYLGTTGRFLADWRCRECGTWRRLSHDDQCCDQHMEYHEIQISYKGVEGHIDAIFKDRQGNYWILDFKTTSTAGSKVKKTRPGAAYIEQIEAYALFLKLQYGIQVKGVMLAFIIRDNPTTPVMWVQEITSTRLKAIKERFKTYKAAHRDVLDAQTKSEVIALLEYGKCNNSYCEVCKLPKAERKTKLLSALKKGQAANRIPIRALAERELSRIAKLSKTSKIAKASKAKGTKRK